MDTYDFSAQNSHMQSHLESRRAVLAHDVDDDSDDDRAWDSRDNTLEAKKKKKAIQKIIAEEKEREKKKSFKEVFGKNKQDLIDDNDDVDVGETTMVGGVPHAPPIDASTPTSTHTAEGVPATAPVVTTTPHNIDNSVITPHSTISTAATPNSTTPTETNQSTPSTPSTSTPAPSSSPSSSSPSSSSSRSRVASIVRVLTIGVASAVVVGLIAGMGIFVGAKYSTHLSKYTGGSGTKVSVVDTTLADAPAKQ